MLVLVYHWQGTYPALANAYKTVPFLSTEWNLFMISRAPKLFPELLTTPAWSFAALIIGIAVTLVLASISYYGVERPILKRFSRWRSAHSAQAKVM